MIRNARQIVAVVLVLLLARAAWCAEADKDEDKAREEKERPTSTLVYPGEGGRLVYKPDEKGNTIPDFSHAGYRGGGVAIPDVPVKVTLEPNAEAHEDDRPRIQAALDKLAGMRPDETGFRGAVLLRKGKYNIGGPLKIPAGGIVLRGEGQTPAGTVVRAYGGKMSISVCVEGSGKDGKTNVDPRKITQDFVPAGARTFALESAEGYKVGDPVSIVRPATPEWLAATAGNKHGWPPHAYTYRYRRVITAIDGNRVTVDVPVIEPMDKKLGGGLLCKYDYPNWLRLVGVENLRFENGGQAISIQQAEDVWVRRVTARQYMYSCVSVWTGSGRVTVEDCAYIDPVGPIKGGYRYGFNLSGQRALVQRCYTRNGRHDFVMHALGKGPNVFLDCYSENAHADSGPHHRWSVGTLYDNVKIDGNGLTAKYAGSRGTGHGWTGAQMVFWNCWARYLNIRKPPTAQNYCIGCKGKKSNRGGAWGHWESYQHRVRPRSLYLAQLKDRLGEDAVADVTIPEQRAGTIRTRLRRDLGR